MKRQPALEKILGRFSQGRILVVGDIMLDRFIWGRVSRISPEAPVPVVVVEREDFLLGGAANVVNNIHSLGGKASLCGVVGDDENGQTLREKLIEIEVQTGGIFAEKGRQTTVKTRIIAHGHSYQQQLVRIDRETNDHLKASTLRGLSEFIIKHLQEVDGVIISDYGKGLLNGRLIQRIIRRGKLLKKLVMIDPKPKHFAFYRGATVVTPNTKEASEASGVSITDRFTLEKAGAILLKRLRCEVLVITRGEEGMAIFEPDQEPFLVHTVAKEVYDVTGAGDTAIGTMALSLAIRARVRDAVRLANYAAGIVVGKMGTATVHREELIKAIKNRVRN